jgi:hypothetical protein
MNQNPTDLGIPTDAIRAETALDGKARSNILPPVNPEIVPSPLDVALNPPC